MDPTTPALLALEAGVSQKRVRDILRDLYGTLPEDTTRWALDDLQADEVRSRLAAVNPSPGEVEAKKSTGLEYVQMAIGQLLDYTDNARTFDAR